MNPQADFSWNAPFSFHPWALFSLFLVSLSLLSYGSLSLIAQLWVGILGVLVPLALAAGLALKKRKQHLPPPSALFLGADRDTPSVPAWLWLLLAAVVLFTRFFRLESVPFWPISDEGIYSVLATSLIKHWDWTLLWTEGKMEPLMIWLTGLFFRVDTPSLLSLRLWTALLSLATVLSAYFFARTFLPRWAAFCFTWLFAFSFWEFTLMHFLTHQVFTLWFEMLALACLGRYAAADRTRPLWLVALVLCNILGLYSYLNWGVVALGTFLAIFAFARRRPERFWDPWIFILAMGLATLPLARARLGQGGLSYIDRLFQLKGFFILLLGYLRGLFFESAASFPYGSNWGGMFDPILGALVLLGFVLALEKMPGRTLLVVLSGLFLGLLPGILTTSVELHRATLSLPFWILLGTEGALSLGPALGKPRDWVPFLALGSVLAALNFYNFISPYCDINRVPMERQWRNLSYADAYQVVKTLDDRTGPVYLFSDFNTDYDNKTLNVACYSFDALQDPRLSAAKPQWAVLIINSHYAPYLTKTFPGTQFRILRTDRPSPEPFGIFLIPTDRIGPDRLRDWIAADQVYREENMKVKNKNLNGTWSPYADYFSSLRDRYPRDPFLTTVYWEKAGLYAVFDKDYRSAADDYRKAADSLPAAHLDYDLSFCLRALGDEKGSRQAYDRAIQLSKVTVP